MTFFRLPPQKPTPKIELQTQLFIIKYSFLLLPPSDLQFLLIWNAHAYKKRWLNPWSSMGLSVLNCGLNPTPNGLARGLGNAFWSDV